jgi:phosphopantetheinyl transferase (holo-ACP synthase)
VKEAACKALNPSLVPTWKELSYLSAAAGKPQLVDAPTVDARLRGPLPNFHANVSHDAGFMCAIVVAEQLNADVGARG